LNILAKSHKKPSAKQLAARKKFAAIMKSGGFKKKAKKTVNHVKPSKTRRERHGGGTDLSRSNINDALLLAIEDPKIKEIVIRK